MVSLSFSVLKKFVSFKGWIGDVTKDYNNTFYVSGVFIIVSGIMILFLPLVGRLYKKRKMEKKRLKLQKRKRKVLNSKILNNPLYNSSNGDNSKHVVMVTIAEDEENRAQQIDVVEQENLVVGNNVERL
jgi:hypothetical protein